MSFKAFISYKHERTSAFAQKLELALKTYAKPLFSAPLRIFRDENYLVPGADLPSMIREALDVSEFLILLASPSAAASQWVGDELDYWCGTLKRSDRLIVVLTEGSIVTVPETKQIDWDETTSLPRLLEQYLAVVPLYVDLSWAKDAKALDLAHPEYKRAINLVSARLRGFEPNELLGIEVREHRRNLRRRKVVATLLITLTMVSIVAALTAWQRTQLAEQRLVEAVRTADHLNVVVHRELESLAGADQVRRELFRRTEDLLDGLKASEHPEVRYSTGIGNLERGRLALTNDDVQKARREFESARHLFSELRERDPTNGWLIEDHSFALVALGDVAREGGQLADARELYQEALFMRRALAENDASIPRWTLLFATAVERLGQVDEAEGRSAEAVGHYHRALELRQQARGMGESGADAIRNVAVSLLRIGDIEAATGLTATARERYRTGAQELEKLLAEAPWDGPLQDELAVFLERLGGEENLTRALSIRDELATAEPENGVWQVHSAIVHAKLGELYAERGDRETARQHLRNGLERLEQLDPPSRGIVEWERQVAELHDRFGDLASTDGSVDSQPLFEHALAIKLDLARADPRRAELRHSIAASHTKLGDVAWGRGDLPGAATSYLAALESLEFLTAADDSRSDWLQDLAGVHDRVAKISDPRLHLELSLQLRETVLAREPEIAEHKYALAKSLQDLGAVIENEEPTRARGLYVRAAATIEAIIAAKPEPPLLWWDGLAVAYTRLGDLQQETGELQQAVVHYEKALSIALQRKTEDPLNLAWAYKASTFAERLGDAIRRDRPRESRTYYEISLAERMRLVKRVPKDVTYQRNLAVAYYKLGELANAEKLLEDARGHFEDALAITGRLIAEHHAQRKWLLDYLDYLSSLSNLDLANDDLAGAAMRLGSIVETRRRILDGDMEDPLEMDELADHAAKLYRTYRTLGDVQTRRNNHEDARDAFAQGLATAREWQAKRPEEPQWLKYELEALAKLNNTAQALGDTRLSQDVQKDMVDCLQTIEQMGVLQDDPVVKAVKSFLADS